MIQDFILRKLLAICKAMCVACMRLCLHVKFIAGSIPLESSLSPKPMRRLKDLLWRSRLAWEAVKEAFASKGVHGCRVAAV